MRDMALVCPSVPTFTSVLFYEYLKFAVDKPIFPCSYCFRPIRQTEEILNGVVCVFPKQAT